jgi:hypothetical protein
MKILSIVQDNMTREYTVKLSTFNQRELNELTLDKLADKIVNENYDEFKKQLNFDKKSIKRDLSIKIVEKLFK